MVEAHVGHREAEEEAAEEEDDAADAAVDGHQADTSGETVGSVAVLACVDESCVTAADRADTGIYPR
ncbi:hypothetical protein GCM10009039_20720 [Halocalculus aciditolerans]|uniref:Uncharacterized protein n=1 Tax=Halocalculus aciditolerans TaxID=1383812 RepID=A0A830F7M5_9EURY|nr:hypothetical protein GCM10009039_20720 [Halocalculus aciditolerans]